MWPAGCKRLATPDLYSIYMLYTTVYLYSVYLLYNTLQSIYTVYICYTLHSTVYICYTIHYSVPIQYISVIHYTTVYLYSIYLLLDWSNWRIEPITTVSGVLSPTSGTLPFSDGDSSALIEFRVKDDTIPDMSYLFRVVLHSPVCGARLGDTELYPFPQ